MINENSPETSTRRRFSGNLTVNLPGLKRKGSVRPNRSVVRGKSLRPVIIHPISNTLPEEESLRDENSQDK